MKHANTAGTANRAGTAGSAGTAGMRTNPLVNTFTAPVSGIYLVSLVANWSTSDGTGSRRGQLSRSGSVSESFASSTTVPEPNSTAAQQVVTAHVHLLAGDTVLARAEQDSGVSA